MLRLKGKFGFGNLDLLREISDRLCDSGPVQEQTQK